MADDVTPSPPRRSYRPAKVFMFVIGPIVAYAAMLADRGNGWSPLVFVLFGIVAGVLSERWTGRGRTAWRRWGRRAMCLGGIAVASAAGSAYSIRDDPAATFAAAFGSPPPAAVTRLWGWKQWYDGMDRIVAFDADQGTIDKLVQSGPKPMESNEYADDQAAAAAGNSAAQQDVIAKQLRQITPFFGVGRLDLRPLTRLRCWDRNRLPSASPNMYLSDLLLWDAASGQAVLVHGWH